MNQPALIQPGDLDAGTQLPCRSRSIAQEQLNRYSRVSGDQNPLHLDSDFASATQFGGIMFLCLDLAKESSKIGHDVTIFTTDLDFANNPKTFNKKLPRIEKIDNFLINRSHV